MTNPEPQEQHISTGSAKYRFLLPQIRESIQSLFDNYPDRRAVITQALWIIQDYWKHIPLEAQEELARFLDVPLVWIREVVSFYNMYYEHPIGEHLIYFCGNISCSLRGARQLFRYLLDQLGIEDRETTPDRKITVERVQCIGACELAPVMQVDGEFVGPLDKTVIDQWILKLKGEDISTEGDPQTHDRSDEDSNE